jgi:hypothetical protein
MKQWAMFFGSLMSWFYHRQPEPESRRERKRRRKEMVRSMLRRAA